MNKRTRKKKLKIKVHKTVIYTIEELLEMGEKYNDVELAKPVGEGD